MGNQIPDGYISLVDAWALFQKQLWNGHDPAAELINVSVSDKMPKENVDTHIKALSKFTKFQHEALAIPFIKGDMGEVNKLSDQTPYVLEKGFNDLCEEYFSDAMQKSGHYGALRSNLRNILIGMANNGLLTSAEVEAHASKYGMNAFEFEPSRSEFDPMAEAYWSLPMTIAWILWRDPNQVREQ